MSCANCSCGRTEDDLLYSPCVECGEYSSEEGYVTPLNFEDKFYDAYSQEDHSSIVSEEEEEVPE